MTDVPPPTHSNAPTNDDSSNGNGHDSGPGAEPEEATTTTTSGSDHRGRYKDVRMLPDGNIDFSGYRRSPVSRALGYFIFASRWLQAPLYVGLIIAQLVYVIVFLVELWHLIDNVIHGIAHLDENAIMLSVLGLIDVVMIANLLIMVIMGGYEIFVSKLGVDEHPDEPDWLHHVNANVLKVKLAISIISISSIHLLRTFIEVGGLGGDNSTTTYTVEGVIAQVGIHLAFIVSAIALQWIDKQSDHGSSDSTRKKHR